MNAQPPVKQSGIPEKIVSAVVPAAIAERLDNSDRVRETWRSFLRYTSTNFNWLQLSGAIIVGYNVYVQLQPAVSAMPFIVGFLAIVTGVAGAMWGALRKQNLPPPPPPPTDPTDAAGA
jgi:hypothetical protein